jgi:hypothetical protein
MTYELLCAPLLLLEIPDCAFTYMVIWDKRISWRVLWGSHHVFGGGKIRSWRETECCENGQMMLTQDQRTMERTLIRPISLNDVENQIKDVKECLQAVHGCTIDVHPRKEQVTCRLAFGARH